MLTRTLGVKKSTLHKIFEYVNNDVNVVHEV
jgi:hypothetical protein